MSHRVGSDQWLSTNNWPPPYFRRCEMITGFYYGTKSFDINILKTDDHWKPLENITTTTTIQSIPVLTVGKWAEQRKKNNQFTTHHEWQTMQRLFSTRGIDVSLIDDDGDGVSDGEMNNNSRSQPRTHGHTRTHTDTHGHTRTHTDTHGHIAVNYSLLVEVLWPYDTWTSFNRLVIMIKVTIKHTEVYYV